MQKLMYKGLLQDNQTLGSIGITKGAKIMLVGSTLNDVLAVSMTTKPDHAESEKAAASKEPLSKQKLHRKILDKGMPEDVMPAIKWCNVIHDIALRKLRLFIKSVLLFIFRRACQWCPSAVCSTSMEVRYGLLSSLKPTSSGSVPKSALKNYGWHPLKMLFRKRLPNMRNIILW